MLCCGNEASTDFEAAMLCEFDQSDGHAIPTSKVTGPLENTNPRAGPFFGVKMSSEPNLDSGLHGQNKNSSSKGS